MALAIFDLDNTLLNGDSDHAWGEFLCRKGVVDEVEYREANDRFYQLYKEGKLDILEFLSFALKPLSQHSNEQLAAWHAEFMSDVVEPMMLPKAEALLRKHRDAGDKLMIITATNRFVTGPIAARLNVPVIIATEPEQVDGKYTGQVTDIPCFQEGKVVRLNRWLKENSESLDGSYFYSDSINDLPLLEGVTHPVAVNPDERLTAIATERNWPILDLRG
jgi:HAD superfamily hydrolase (TIGR01490 family)